MNPSIATGLPASPAVPGPGGPVAEAPPRFGWLASSLGVLRIAWRVFRQNWPTMLALALLAEILRMAAILGAAFVAVRHQELSFLVFALAPVLYLIPIVLMLHRIRASLPELGTRVKRRLVPLVGGALIPFLIYYAAAGYIVDDKELLKSYLTIFVFLDSFNPDGVADPNRLRFVDPVIPLTWVPVVILVIAITRRFLTRSALAQRYPTLGFPAVYFEVLWLILALDRGRNYIGIGENSNPWIRERTISVFIMDLWHSDFHQLGLLAAPFRLLRDAWSSILSSVDDGLILPIIALLTAAAVYGIQTEAPSSGPTGRPGNTQRAVGRALVRIPREALMSRVGPAIFGIGLMRRAGLITIMVFCLASVAAATVPSWLFLGERTIIGPHDLNDVWIVLDRILSRFNSAVAMTLLVSLMVGAVAWVIGNDRSASAS